MRFRKLSIRITLYIILATSIGFFAQTILASYNMLTIMQNKADIELTGVVEQFAARLDAYDKKEFAYLDGFMASKEMKAVVENPFDDETRAFAQDYTTSYINTIPNSKSLFYVEYNGTVVTHNLPEMIGYQNDAEIVKLIQGLYYNPEGKTVYNSVTAVSPATNEVSIIYARSSYKANGQPAGYASVEIDKAEVYDLLENGIHIAENQDVVVSGVRNPVVYYSTNPE
jgi:methyl-accepting chemotaxis protein